MGFLNGLKKLFGVGESTTEIVESSAYVATVVEEVAIEKAPVVKEVVVEEVKQVEEPVKVESKPQTETTTVKDIKYKSRRSNPNSEEQPKPTSEKTKKPYKRRCMLRCMDQWLVVNHSFEELSKKLNETI